MENEMRSIDLHLNQYFLSEMMTLIYKSTLHSITHQNPIQPNQISNPSSLHSNQFSHPIIQENVSKQIDQLGYKIGYILSERLSKEKSRIQRDVKYVSNQIFQPDSLEVIKFICKDLWLSIFNKQVDNLRTNHKGIYVIQDYGFKPFLKLISSVQSLECKSFIQNILIFHCAIIRGSLMNLGLQTQVKSDQSVILPQCSIQIHIIFNPQILNSNSNSTSNSTSNPSDISKQPVNSTSNSTSNPISLTKQVTEEVESREA
ncbi:transport protein particle component-domain-containing protein [Melampsora americana]|nr:transport protein particle component-domain-containing protein [Melampsora americana]